MRKYVIIFLIIAAVATATEAQQQGSVVRLDPALNNIVPPDVRVEKLADSPEAGSRDGPVWVRDGGYLLYADVHTKINKWNPANGKVSTFLDHTHIGGMTLDRQGRIVYCLHSLNGEIVRVETDGKQTVLASQYEGKPLQGPNDLVYKSDGALYFTAPGVGDTINPGDVPSVYLLKGEKLQLLIKDMPFPNGLAFSPDEKHLYVNDSLKKIIMRFDVQPDDTIANGQVFVDMNSDPAEGHPDGMKVDQKGNIYCGGPGGFWIISPQGKHLGTILFSENYVDPRLGKVRGGVSDLGFGDADGKTLFITSRPGLYRIRLKIPGIWH